MGSLGNIELLTLKVYFYDFDSEYIVRSFDFHMPKDMVQLNYKKGVGKYFKKIKYSHYCINIGYFSNIHICISGSIN